MTTICYMNGKMAADRKNTCRRKLNTYTTASPKIFLSQCKRFCYAQTGATLEHNLRLESESNIAKDLEKYYLNPDMDIRELKSLTLERDWLMVMTKDKLFLAMYQDQCMLGDTSHYYSFGSSEEYATTLMAIGVTSFTEIYDFVSRIDVGTSKQHIVYDQDDLDPFKEEK